MAGESGVPHGGGMGSAWVYQCDPEKDLGAVG